MKNNGLGWLSLVSLVGLLGFFTPNKALLGFLGFACYFRYFFVTPDELFMQNLRSAASIGFFFGLGTTVAAVLVRVLWPLLLPRDLALISGFVVSVISFTIALILAEIKESRGVLT